MKRLKRIVLVQFYLHEAVDIEIEGATAFLGPNGSGKSSTLDAVQIAMLGGNQQYARFNTQSVSSKQRRSLSGYCLGLLRNPENDSDVIGRARDVARTYIILVFDDGAPGGTLSVGLCIEADIEAESHDIKGLFVLPGQDLHASDCVIREDKGERPTFFSDFRLAATNQAKAIGRTAIFTDKPSEYVSELLYALNGQRMSDPRRFMSSFVKSMTLKNVDSIDQFVRDYVVEPNPVDIAAFRKQVEQFVSLRDLIKKTKARIARLTGILSDYDRALAAERRIATLSAIAAIFHVEWLSERIDSLDERIELLTDQRKKALETAQQAKDARVIAHQEVTGLKVQLEADQTEQMRLRLQEQVKSSQELIRALHRPGLDRANRLINALRDVQEFDGFATVREDLQLALTALTHARNEDDPGAAAARELAALKPKLAPIRRAAQAQLQAAIRHRDTLVEDREAARRRISAASQTGRLLNDGAALLLELVGRAGMQAQPVSALASITASDWAQALEAYLGSDRDALVITDGDTREALKILRAARQQGMRVDGAAVVQPNHLRKVDISSKSDAFAVGVIETTNETARRFLWNKFGSMRLVVTEAELEEHSRAITKDGMLSQGGLTKSIRIAQLSDLRLGHDHHDTGELSRFAAKLKGEIDETEGRIQHLQALDTILSIDDADGADTGALEQARAVETKKAAEQQLAALDLSHLEQVRATLNEAEERYAKLDEEYTHNDRIAVGLGEQIKTCEDERRDLAGQHPEKLEAEKLAAASSLVDQELLDQLKDEIERAESDYENRLEEVDNKLSNNRSRMKGAEERASFELNAYVQDERLDVQVSDMSWHDRHEWAVDEKAKLTDTQLHSYEEQAEQARLASEETLRSDIAMSLHDRFREMEFERRERNKILEMCPPFTGGERYKFTSTVAPQYESLVRYINQVAREDQNLTLFGDDPDDINETLRELVDAAAESNDATAVLDYRSFFTFDLEILVDGKRVDKMSSRQGAGSNGEHIAPMYVAAGAALAKAYRLNNRKGQTTGTGLICLDEAFHGMDTTNAVATARFLQSLGLQLLMAGPELERTKLAPITQTIYDLDREGTDLMMERTCLKPAANGLMVSDMPSENPAVMPAAFQQLGLEPPEAVESLEGEQDDTSEVGAE